MNTRALAGLLGVAMMGVACGTSPTAVEEPAAGVVAAAEGAAGGASRGRNVMPVPACNVGKVRMKVVASGYDGSTMEYWARLHAQYFEVGGKPASAASCGALSWSVTAGASISQPRFAAFDEAYMTGPRGKYLATATASNGTQGSIIVELR